MEDETDGMYITSDMAHKVVGEAVKKFGRDGDKPFSIAVLDPYGAILAQKSVDGVNPGPTKLCVKKAYTCLQFGCDTKDLEDKNLNPANFADNNISCFAGGELLRGERKKDDFYIMGAVGVSGRKSRQRDGIQTLDAICARYAEAKSTLIST